MPNPSALISACSPARPIGAVISSAASANKAPIATVNSMMLSNLRRRIVCHRLWPRFL
ncbi:MAG: hypothetical protein U9R15_04650 [Chloroflexota bacterium]|nr:hypothetical protein [Chloroflexota bacterium]